jgi:uncharacterized DUF497 family protein
MQFDEFEWDENKRQENLAQHKIDFEDILVIFARPFWSKRSDRHGEERYLAVGSLDNRYVTVVYTLRHGRCRLISARKARKNEREAYCKAFGRRLS